jgi:hypothetical protein
MAHPQSKPARPLYVVAGPLWDQLRGFIVALPGPAKQNSIIPTRGSNPTLPEPPLSAQVVGTGCVPGQTNCPDSEKVDGRPGVGREATAACRWLAADGTVREGTAKVLLEGDHLILRAPLSLTLPFPALSDATVDGDVLELAVPAGSARITLGAATAADWLHRIRNPRGLLDKLGIRRGMPVTVAGADADPALRQALDEAGCPIRQPDSAAPESAAGTLACILLTLARLTDLQLVPRLVDRLAPSGMLWVCYPKGPGELNEGLVRQSLRVHSLVDVKVCRISALLTGVKFVRLKDSRKDMR